MKRKVFSVMLITLIMLSSMFMTQSYVQAKEVDDIPNMAVIISDTNSIKSGAILTDEYDGQKAKVEKYSIENFKETLNTVTCIDMDTFYQSDKERKSRIKDSLNQEFANNKRIVFFGSDETLNPMDVYKMLDLTPTYSFAVLDKDKSESINDDAVYNYSNIVNNLIGLSVEKIDNDTNVINYFYDNDEKVETKIDALNLMVNVTSVDSDLAQQKEPESISTQAYYKTTGSGYADKTNTPIVYCYEQDWKMKLNMYLARTKITNKNTLNPVNYWQFTSQISLSYNRTGTNANYLTYVDVWNACHYSYQELYDYDPDTTLSNSTKGYSVSGGINDKGELNAGVSFNESISLPDITVVPSPFWNINQVNWRYTYNNKKSNAALYGNKVLQQIYFKNTNGSAVGYAAFKIGTGQNGSAETNWYSLSAADLVYVK